MNRVDHWAEALRLLDAEFQASTVAANDAAQRLRDLAQVHATLATIPDSISGALDARSKIRERKSR